MTSDAFGWGAIVAGTAYQPLRFPGQMSDEETTAIRWDSVAAVFKAARPPLSDNRYRVYDPLTGGYLQSDPRVAQSWNSYAYAANDPVGEVDPTGLLMITGAYGASSFDGFDKYEISNDGCSGGSGGGGSTPPPPPPPICQPNTFHNTKRFSYDSVADQNELMVCGFDFQTNVGVDLNDPGVIACMCQTYGMNICIAQSTCRMCGGRGRIGFDGPISVTNLVVYWECDFQCAGGEASCFVDVWDGLDVYYDESPP
jgi:hypothetical protein